MTPEQIIAIRCAHADLVGSLEAVLGGTIPEYDWAAHKDSITDLKEAFPEILNDE